MPRPARFWLDLYKAFDPSETLTGERSHLLYCSREHDPFDSIVQAFRPEEQPAKLPILYFTGHRGSGKSSFLFRLREHFNTHYFVVYVTVEASLDSEKANIIDLLLLIGTAIFQAAVRENYTLDKRLLEELGEAVYAITYSEKEKVRDEAFNFAEMAQQLLVVTASIVGNKIGEKLAEGLSKAFKVSSGVSEEIARSRTIEPQIGNILNKINLIIGAVETATEKQLLVIMDDLDKIQQFEKAEEIFIKRDSLKGPQCRIVYTVPMLVYTSLNFGDVDHNARSCFLPNIRLYDRRDAGKSYPKGYAEMREVVAKRLATVGLKEADLFEKDTLNRLIFSSGGVMRLLIQLVNEACRFAEREGLDTINRDAAHAGIAVPLAEYTRRLTREALTELKEVHATHLPSKEKLCADLLHAQMILAYQNDRTWFDAHPLLWDDLT